MEIEIEIKLLFNAQFESELYKKINTQRFISTKKQLLHNVYFDTADRLLREMDMGLRVRSSEGRSVQTIKTAGCVIGGLHQRPEYNESIQGGRPELARFTSKIWPEDCDLKTLENDLIPIFSTDFERQTWLVEMAEGTLIEVAYDCGFIEANQGKLDICEIELELVKGDEKQLFILADEIAQLPEVRLGNVSKSQRGYMLKDDLSFHANAFTCSKIDASMSLEQALLTNLQHGLRHIQYHENCYLETFQGEALHELLTGLKFLHQNLNMFKQLSVDLLKASWIKDLHWLVRSFSWLDTRMIYQNLLENKGYYLRKLPKPSSLLSKLAEQNETLPDQQAIVDILTSTRYCQFILKLNNWLISFEKSTFSGEKEDAIQEFACESLTHAWGGLKEALETNKEDKLSSSQGVLESNLLISFSVGNLFPLQENDNFCSPWLDIKQGLKELDMIHVIADFADQETDCERSKDYAKWIKRKKSSLLHALEQSRERALLEEPYW